MEGTPLSWPVGPMSLSLGNVNKNYSKSWGALITFIFPSGDMFVYLCFCSAMAYNRSLSADSSTKDLNLPCGSFKSIWGVSNST